MDIKKIVAIMAAFLILLAILGRIVSVRSANQASTVAASPTDQLPVDQWHVTDSRSPMDDSKTVALALDSNHVIQGPVGSNKPTLIVRCNEGKTQVYVSTGMAASVEQDLDGGAVEYHTVKIRLDQAQQITRHSSLRTSFTINTEGLLLMRAGLLISRSNWRTPVHLPFNSHPSMETPKPLGSTSEDYAIT
jgi:hypothetical protein